MMKERDDEASHECKVQENPSSTRNRDDNNSAMRCEDERLLAHRRKNAETIPIVNDEVQRKRRYMLDEMLVA